MNKSYNHYLLKRLLIMFQSIPNSKTILHLYYSTLRVFVNDNPP